VSSARADIREAVVAVLRAANTAAGLRVFDHPYNARTTFPALVVEDAGADLSDGNITEAQIQLSIGGDLERRFRFVTVAEVKQGEGSARERDELLTAVEAALVNAFNLGQLPGVRDLQPLAYQAANNNLGEQPIRRGLQVWQATYFTARGDAATPL
jgi:hypothetical protein